MRNEKEQNNNTDILATRTPILVRPTMVKEIFDIFLDIEFTENIPFEKKNLSDFLIQLDDIYNKVFLKY